jgi:hypothetical protein
VNTYPVVSEVFPKKGRDMDLEPEHELPFLGGISAFLRWLEELVVLVSGPMLTAGLGIGLVSLLSDGALLVSAPWMLYAWAISQTVGVDGQLVGAWYRVKLAQQRGRWSVVLCFVLLGLVLAYVGFIGSLIFAMQQAYHFSTAQALAQLGLDSRSWLWQRAGVSVFLVCLSGYLRYQAPRKHTMSLDAQKQVIQEQMQLDAMKREARAQRMQGLAALAGGTAKAMKQAVQQVQNAEQAETMDTVESGEGTHETGDTESEAAAPASPLPMRWPRQSHQKKRASR